MSPQNSSTTLCPHGIQGYTFWSAEQVSVFIHLFRVRTPAFMLFQTLFFIWVPFQQTYRVKMYPMTQCLWTVPNLLYPDDMEDFQMYSSDDVPSSDTLQKLRLDGSSRIGGGNRQKQCKTCQKCIDLGDSENGDNRLVNHEGKSRCLAAVHDNMAEEEWCAAAVALDNLCQTTSLSLRTPYRLPRFPH